MVRSIVVACITLASLVVLAAHADACSCMQIGPGCQAFWKTDAVFDATVESIGSATRPDSGPGDRPVAISEKVVKLTVRESWKGVAAGPLEVVTAESDASCGYNFKPGRRYLVFAWKRPVDGRWSVSLCSATHEFDGSGDDARFLASLARPPAGGRVFGSVKSFERNFDTEHSTTQRDVESAVRLIGGGQERRVTSTNGKFEFAGLEAQRYRLELLLPDGYTTSAAGRDVEIPNPRACAQEDYALSPSARITGHLLTVDGRPAAGVQVEATDPAARSHPLYGLPVLGARTNADGDFEIAGVPPGRYIVGINLKDLPSAYNPYGRTLYPSDGGDGQVVTIGTGHAFDLGTWRLPPPLPVVKVGPGDAAGRESGGWLLRGRVGRDGESDRARAWRGWCHCGR